MPKKWYQYTFGRFDKWIIRFFIFVCVSIPLSHLYVHFCTFGYVVSETSASESFVVVSDKVLKIKTHLLLVQLRAGQCVALAVELPDANNKTNRPHIYPDYDWHYMAQYVVWRFYYDYTSRCSISGIDTSLKYDCVYFIRKHKIIEEHHFDEFGLSAEELFQGGKLSEKDIEKIKWVILKLVSNDVGPIR